MQTPPPVSSDPLREALEALIDIWDDGKHHPDNRAYVSGSFAAMIEEARATLTTIPSATEPDYWPSAKVVVHEDEVRHGVCRVTATLYAPGLPPGEYDLYLSSCATEPDRNAARYLWLRENWFTMAAKYPGRVEFSLGHERWAPIPESDLDAAIDAAIATRTTTPRATEPDRNAAPESWKLLKDTTQDERSWPEDYVDENGQYFNTCHNCLRVFLGYKRRGTCKVCATRTTTPSATEPTLTDEQIECHYRYKHDLSGNEPTMFFGHYLSRWRDCERVLSSRATEPDRNASLTDEQIDNALRAWVQAGKRPVAEAMRCAIEAAIATRTATKD